MIPEGALSDKAARLKFAHAIRDIASQAVASWPTEADREAQIEAESGVTASAAGEIMELIARLPSDMHTFAAQLAIMALLLYLGSPVGILPKHPSWARPGRRERVRGRRGLLRVAGAEPGC
jgi:hypothetical protein